jgi:hypothetical protein
MLGFEVAVLVEALALKPTNDATDAAMNLAQIVGG